MEPLVIKVFTPFYTHGVRDQENWNQMIVNNKAVEEKSRDCYQGSKQLLNWQLKRQIKCQLI